MTGFIGLVIRFFMLRISKDLTIVQNDKGERTLYSMMQEQLQEHRALVKNAEQNEDGERRQKEVAIRAMDKALKDNAECSVKMERHEAKINSLEAKIASLETTLLRRRDPDTGAGS